MNRRMLAALLGAALMLAGACRRNVDEKEAIRQGVVKHLSAVQGLNLPNMEVNLLNYSVHDGQASAQVEVRAKGAEGAAGSMQLAYRLEKRGSEWVVVKTAPAGGSMQHPAPGEIPPGATLPAGHPGSSGASGPVHPDFSEILKSGQQSQQPPAPSTTDPAPPKP